MSVTHDQYRRARHIVNHASVLTLKAIRPNNRGRKTLDPKILLTGLQLSIATYHLATVTKAFYVLTHDLMVEDQRDLGVRYTTKNGKEEVISLNDLYALTKRITKMLDFTRMRAPLLSKVERHVRRNCLDAIVAALLDPTLPARPEGSFDYAVDGTGIWASEKSKKRIPDETPPDLEHEEDCPEGDPNLRLDEDKVASNSDHDDHRPKPGKGQHGESDASRGAKTDKNGTRKYFYGYDIEAVVRVPGRAGEGKGVRQEPNLLERLVVIPGGRDVVNPCLRMFDRMRKEGIKIGSILVDRRYSFKKYDRWMQELLNRGIEQVADAHSADQGFKDWGGMKIAAGWAHCPSTPDRLGKIPALGPNSPQEDVEKFTALVEERRAYSAKRINPLDKTGRIRFGCPALNGTVGCSLRPGTEATAIGFNLPIIENPPSEIGRPALCTQMSVQLKIKTDEQKKAMKLHQREYWGSQKWRENYARRTFVESWFGVLKNDTSTGFHRGSHQFVGLPMVTIALALAASTSNMQLLRAWHEETGLGDPTHPILQADEPFHGFTQLTEEQAEKLKMDYLDKQKAA